MPESSTQSLHSMQLIEPSHYVRMPWKNGLGETLEIQRHTDPQGLRYRISQAAVVEDGMFSNFDGLHRTLVLLEGEGLVLQHKRHSDSHTHALNNAMEMARFNGGDDTYATLNNGTIKDLNIMVRADDTQAKVTAISAPCTLPAPSDKYLFRGLYTHRGCDIGLPNAGSHIIEDHSTLILSDHHPITLIQGDGILIEIYDTKNGTGINF